MNLRSFLQPMGLDPRSIYDRVLVRHGLARPKLWMLAIEPTNQCNLKCKICLSKGSRKEGFMKSSIFNEAIIQARDMGVKRIAMPLAGEPLLHPNFLKLLRVACAMMPEVIYFTNGNYLDEEKAMESVNYGTSMINISLDGIGKKHEEMRPGSDYRRVKRNIERLIEIRGKNIKPIISVNMVLYDQSPNDIKDFLDEWVGKVDQVGVSDSYSSSFYYDYLHDFWKESPTYDAKYCGYLYYYMAVLWDGRVIPCCDVTGREVVGDLNKESLQDIWYGDRYKEIRKGNVLKSCNGCNRWKKRFKYNKVGNIVYDAQYKNYVR